MDQTPVKLCHLVMESNKELRKMQISWTFKIPYYSRAAHAQPCTFPTRKSLSSCINNSHGSRTEHALTHIWSKLHLPVQFVLDFPTAGKKTTKHTKPTTSKKVPSILKSWNSLKRNPILHVFFFRTSIHAAFFYKFLEAAILVTGGGRRIYKLETQYICFPLILDTVLTRVKGPLILGKSLKASSLKVG